MKSGKRFEKNKFFSHKPQAFNYALWLLGLKAYSQKEIFNKLTIKGYEAGEIETTLNRLINSGLINDLNLAINWIRNRDSNLPRGQFVLFKELQHKGIECQLIEKALEICSKGDSSTQELNRAKTLIEKIIKKSSYQKKEPLEKRRYLLALLARKGFNFETSKQIIDEIS